MVINKNGDKYYKVALHLHSTRSDGRKTPEEIAAEYKADGYDAIAFTDHWYYGASDEIAGVHIISGAEYNLGVSDTIDGVMHIVGLGMSEDPRLEKNTATRTETVEAIRRVGGIAVLAHPAWSVNTVKDAEQLPGFVATEIYNAVSEAHNSMRPYSSHFVDAIANAGIYPTILATDDAHYYDGSDNRRGWVMVKAEELTDKAIVEALARGDSYATQGPELYVRREGDVIIADSSDCVVIGSLSNKSYANGRTVRGECVNHFEYKILDGERWVRIEAMDKEGRFAWSNIFAV